MQSFILPSIDIGCLDQSQKNFRIQISIQALMLVNNLLKVSHFREYFYDFLRFLGLAAAIQHKEVVERASTAAAYEQQYRQKETKTG